MEERNLLSLWDTLCVGSHFNLCLSERQKEEVVIPSEELILEGVFIGYNELSYPREHILQLYPSYLVVRDTITRKIYLIIDLSLVKCDWTRLKNH